MKDDKTPSNLVHNRRVTELPKVPSKKGLIVEKDDDNKKVEGYTPAEQRKKEYLEEAAKVDKESVDELLEELKPENLKIDTKRLKKILGEERIDQVNQLEEQRKQDHTGPGGGHSR